MPTPNERKGLLFLAFVALSGAGVRLWRSRTPPPPAAQAAALQHQLVRVDSARAAKRESKTKRAREKRPSVIVPADTQPIDINIATIEQIELLPGIGPAMARRIAAHRDSAGPFVDLAALCDVRGIGPTLAERLRPLVTFAGRISPVSDACDSPSNGAGKAGAERGRKRP